MVKFNKEKHEYSDNGKVLISVTQLLKKHGLSTDFSNVDKDLLNAKAERGTMIHQEVERYIKKRDIGFTSELMGYIDLITKNELVPAKAEVRVSDGFIAGTTDQWGYDTKNNQYYIGDVKTGSVINYNEVRWQLSLYDYLLPEKACKTPRKLYCFHLTDNPRMISVDPVPREEIERLLECERKGEIYKQEVVVTEDRLAQLVQLKYDMDELELRKKEIDRQMSEITDTVKELMRDKGIKTFENDLVKITYVAPTTRESIDSKKLKAELPEIAAKYTKTSEVKDSVRITWREA